MRVRAVVLLASTRRRTPELRMLLVACGTEDGLMGVNRQFKDWLKSKDIRFTDTETPGFGHVWGLWRQDLAQLAPLLFQPAKK